MSKTGSGSASRLSLSGKVPVACWLGCCSARRGRVESSDAVRDALSVFGSNAAGDLGVGMYRDTDFGVRLRDLGGAIDGVYRVRW